MPQLRIRIALFKGQESIDLSRLTALPDELTKLLRNIADDAGVPPVDNHWRASNFSDGSLEFTAASSDRLSKDLSLRCARIGEAVLSGDRDDAFRHGVTDRTLLQYAILARKVQPGEMVCLGILEDDKRFKNPKSWHTVTAEAAQRLTTDVRPHIDYHGAVLGCIHAVYIQVDRPHFDLRDLTREDLVKCYFSDDMHDEIVKMLTPKDRRVNVGGMLRANRLTKTIESIRVDRIKAAETITNEEFERFFGSAPEITGGQSAADFIADAREDEH